MIAHLFTALLLTGQAEAKTVVSVAAPAVTVGFNTGAIHWDVSLGRYVWVPAPAPVVAPVPAHTTMMAAPRPALRQVWVPAHYVGHGRHTRYVPGYFKLV